MRKSHAGPPFWTDDPEPVDYHNWEFYIASQNAKLGGDWSGTAPHVEINYGSVPDLQLHLIAPMAYDSPPTGAGHYGVGDIELGAKYRFIQETNGWPQVGTFPLLEAPAGSAQNNLGNGHLQVFLPGVAAKKLGVMDSLRRRRACGIDSLSGRQNWGFVGGVLQKQIFTNVLLGAEVYHQTTLETDFPNVGTGFNIGTVIDFSEHQHLLFSPAGRLTVRQSSSATLRGSSRLTTACSNPIPASNPQNNRARSAPRPGCNGRLLFLREPLVDCGCAICQTLDETGRAGLRPE